MRTRTLRTAWTVALGTVALVACTDSATAPTEIRGVNQLEQLASQAIAAGDLSGGERLKAVANALRYGVRPTRYEAFTGDRVEEYLALVLVEEHRGLEPSIHERFDRFFYLWHQTEVGSLHLLRMKTTGEFGWMDPNATDRGAAEYTEGAGPLTHLDAFAGEGRIMELELGKACTNVPKAQQGHRIECNRGLFRVGFEMELAHEEDVGAATHMKMWASAQEVRGIKWTLYDPR